MSQNVVNQAPYLQTSREFSKEAEQLGIELSKAYIDIANAMNLRKIGIYALNRPSIGGESWYLQGNKKQQNLQQPYTFTAAGSFAHNLTGVAQFSPKSCGVYNSGSSSFGVIYGSNVAIAGQVSFYVDSTNITILSGAGAPAITSGIIILEWLSAV